MTDTQDVRGLVAALRNGQQCDEDGVMCIVSRQACHEAADALEAMQSEAGVRVKDAKQRAKEIAGAIGVTAHSDIFPYVERAVALALASLEITPAAVTDAAEYGDPEGAPKDGTLLRLLVKPDDEAHTSFEDSEAPYETIGFNHLGDTGIDEWQFAGWDWCHDCITQGYGEVIGWLPFHTPTPSARHIENRNEEAGFTEFVNADGPTIVREIDGAVAILLDMKTRDVVGYRVYATPSAQPDAGGGVEIVGYVIPAIHKDYGHTGWHFMTRDMALPDATPLIRKSDYTAVCRERDEARAEVERMTPLAGAYDYLESPAGREMAEQEIKRLRKALEPFTNDERIKLAEQTNPQTVALLGQEALVFYGTTLEALYVARRALNPSEGR